MVDVLSGVAAGSLVLALLPHAASVSAVQAATALRTARDVGGCMRVSSGIPDGSPGVSLDGWVAPGSVTR
jgi:hypothetical protein